MLGVVRVAKVAVRGRFAAALPLVMLLLGSAAARAAGPVVPPASVPGPPDAWTLVTGWSFEVEYVLPLLLAAWAYWAGVRKVNREHPGNPVPRRRLWYWMAGLGTLVVALESPIGLYDTTLFSDHMIQHLLLAMVAAPLLALAAPITLVLRVATPEARREILLPILHSRFVAVIGHPVVAWVLFTAYMFASHFSPLYEWSLESPTVHLFEHAGYLGFGLLFWWPVVGVDPAPQRMSWPSRLLYLGLGMPWSSFLGLAIMSANGLLYPWYGAVPRSWGFSPLEDQTWAGGIMWVGGDAMFMMGLILALGAWLRAEEVEGRRADDRMDREQAAAARARARAVSRTGEP
jgi:cytochrome c oxidase assembly factor CtaG